MGYNGNTEEICTKLVEIINVILGSSEHEVSAEQVYSADGYLHPFQCTKSLKTKRIFREFFIFFKKLK